MASRLQRVASAATAARGASRGTVTLVIYDWRESQPGTLSWVFPSLGAALRAARAMSNALRWVIVRGQRAVDGEVDIGALRRTGSVLIERVV
jgi:hypothetical protein